MHVSILKINTHTRTKQKQRKFCLWYSILRYSIIVPNHRKARCCIIWVNSSQVCYKYYTLSHLYLVHVYSHITVNMSCLFLGTLWQISLMLYLSQYLDHHYQLVVTQLSGMVQGQEAVRKQGWLAV